MGQAPSLLYGWRDQYTAAAIGLACVLGGLVLELPGLATYSIALAVMAVVFMLCTFRMRARNVRMRVAIDNISQGLCIFDKRERMVVCNRRYMQLYNVPHEVVRQGRTLASLLACRAATGSFNRDPVQ